MKKKHLIWIIPLILCDLPYGTTACSWDEIIDLEKMWKEMLRISKKEKKITNKRYGKEVFR